MPSISLQYCMARLFRDWMCLAIVRVLFPYSNAQFRAVSSRSNQEEGSILACDQVLLEIVDRDLWCLVLIRYPFSPSSSLEKGLVANFWKDFVTFPNGVFSATIISSIVQDSSILRTAEWQLLLGILSLPGVFIGAWLCDRIGRKQTMMIGFGGYLVFGLIIGCAYDKITKIIPLFVVFYGLMQSSGNLGPGDMLGLISSETYATAVRGTCYGISAAWGKTGGAIGTQAFTPIENNLGKRWTFIVAAICGVVGIIVTYFFVPNVTGENLKENDERFRAYLVANGWDGEMGEDDLKAIADEGIPPAIVDGLKHE